MYVGFSFITLSSVVYFLNSWTIVLGICSAFVYQMVIPGEERFLDNRFGIKFIDYKRKAGRYF